MSETATTVNPRSLQFDIVVCYLVLLLINFNSILPFFFCPETADGNDLIAKSGTRHHFLLCY